MAYKLVCTVPMHGYRRGQEVTEPSTVERLSVSHGHHFVKVSAPDPAPEQALLAPVEKTTK